METLRTIRQQLVAVEEAYRKKRLRETIDTLVNIHDLVDVLASAFLMAQFQLLADQLEKLANLGLVVIDLEDRCEAARREPKAAEAAAILEDLWDTVDGMLAPAGKLLLRTNIFARGKKIFLPFGPEDTLRQIATVLRKKYPTQIIDYFARKGDTVANPDAVDIFFYGARIWEDPDEALISIHTPIQKLLEKETEGILWFPVLPGEYPVLFDENGEDLEGSGFMNLLENFTVEADVNQLQNEMQRMADGLLQKDAQHVTDGQLQNDMQNQNGAQHVPDGQLQNDMQKTTGTFPDASREVEVDRQTRGCLVRGEGTEREERIPLVGERISIGRGRENDIQILNDIKVSRFHCKVVHEEDGYFVVDNASSNGTIVDGEMIARHRLGGGETIEIGNTIFRFIVD